MRRHSFSAALGCGLVFLMVHGWCAAETGFSYRGQAVQGGLLIARTAPGAQVTVDGAAVEVTPEGHFMIGFGRFDEAAKTVAITHPDGHSESHRIAVQMREFPTERVDGLPPAKVNPPAEVGERIAREQKQVVAARKMISHQAHFLEEFIWPARGRVSGVYGSRRILNGEPKRPHYGMDIANRTGTAVVAPASGVVRLAEADLYYSGGTVILDHGYGLNSTYLHLSRVDVQVGQVINRGEKIGEIGATGRASGPHLDWRLNLGSSVRLDPQLVIPAEYTGAE